MKTPAPTCEPRRTGTLVALILCAGAGLAACSPESQPLAADLASPSLPDARPHHPAPAEETTVIGPVDDLRALEVFLRANAAETRSPPPAAVVARTVDGGPDHPRITLVYMADPGWCGSGGCTLFILEPAAAGLAKLAHATLVHPPVLILDTRAKGMPDISVRVRGDYYPGDGEKFVVLPFDGQTYASNPTMPPAYPLRGPADGEIAISEEEVAIAFGR